MKFSSEAKIGLIGIVTLSLLIWGVNYLKGRNILSSTYTLHTSLDNTGGLESSSPVLMSGMKIGYINEIELRPDETNPIKISLSIENTYPIREGSCAILFSADLLGTKAIRIESSGLSRFLADNDTIQTMVEADMLSTLQDQLVPVMQQISKLSVSLDTLVQGIDSLIDAETTRETLEHLSVIASSLNNSLKPGGSLDQSFKNLESFSSMMKTQEDEVASLTSHLNSISQSIDSAGINQLSSEILAVTHKFNILMEQINSGEGSMGKLLYADSLYLNLDLLISDLDKLIRNLNENPEDYVHFSLFGNSQKKNK